MQGVSRRIYRQRIDTQVGQTIIERIPAYPAVDTLEYPIVIAIKTALCLTLQLCANLHGPWR